MVPHGLEKPGRMRVPFPVREKSGNFGQTGKFHTKYWKELKISTQSTGKMGKFKLFFLLFEF